MNINLENYKLVQPTTIKKCKGEIKNFYDITVEEDHTFHINIGCNQYLSHNCDGGHIFSLLVNFFFKWFPYIIDEGRLFSLKIPLMSVDNGKNRDYFYDKSEFDEHVKKKKPLKNIRYLKGLGSLDIRDWEIIMADMQLLIIKKGDDAKKWMDMAFSQDSGPRKLWLSNKFK